MADRGLDFQLLFEESPDVLPVPLPDSPLFTQVAATRARLAATQTTREQTIGHGHRLPCGTGKEPVTLERQCDDEMTVTDADGVAVRASFVMRRSGARSHARRQAARGGTSGGLRRTHRADTPSSVGTVASHHGVLHSRYDAITNGTLSAMPTT